MRKIFVCVMFVLFRLAFSETIEVNGGFEHCTASKSGIILPEGWLINAGVSKNALAYITREPDCLRTGKFALQIEVERGGTMYLMKFHNLKARAGDAIKLSVWSMGKGKLALGFIQNSSAPGKHDVFLGTMMKPCSQINSEEQWVESQFTYSIENKSKDKTNYEDFTLSPVIYVNDKADLLLDDLKVEFFQQERNSDR